MVDDGLLLLLLVQAHAHTIIVSQQQKEQVISIEFEQKTLRMLIQAISAQIKLLLIH